MPACVKCQTEVERVAAEFWQEKAGLCQICLDACLGAEDEFRERQRAALIPKERAAALCALGIPVDYARKIAEHGIPTLTMKPDKPWLVLEGISGSGKTHAAAQILANSSGRRLFIDWPLFLEQRKSVIGSEDADPMSSALRADLLVVDDLGGERQTEYSLDCAQLLFSDRYNRVAATIITTNLTGPDIMTRYGKRIGSRIYERAAVVQKTKQWRAK